MNPLLFWDQRSSFMIFILGFLSLISSIPPSHGYDPLDRNAKVIVKWDILHSGENTYNALVSIYNNQLYRHVESPGWKLSWIWQGDDVIWAMQGAEATEQGNCSSYKASAQLPHSCEKRPVIIDLLPGAPYNMRTANCCKGGVLTSLTQDPSQALASFQLTVGWATNNISGYRMPGNFSLGLPGYTCGEAVQVPATRFPQNGGRRYTWALGTYDVTCVYSQFLASPTPKCCVSLSAFYNNTIVPCPKCSCNCKDNPRTSCVKNGKAPSLLQLKSNAEEEQAPLVGCSDHMCPIQVHWHVKQSYKEYWRVKMTVTNLNYVKNYSHWNLVVQHPNLRTVIQVFSFNFQTLNEESINDTGVFWGIQYYNDMLLSSGDQGNVQNEMLLRKEVGNFTFSNGWTFPRRIMFNGDECVMPPPDEFPRLPNHASHKTGATDSKIICFFFIFVTLML